MKMFAAAVISAAVLAFAAPASAATYVVDSYANSSSGGTGLATISLASGQNFTVSSSTDDLWSLGGLPRFTDGNGLTGDRFATATDDSGRPIGSQIGANFGTWTQDGYTAAYGSLVGKIGGVYQELGANFSGAAWGAGTLYLYNWDSNFGDNSGVISFNVSAVPEPATWAMLFLGLGGIGCMLRMRRFAKSVA